MLTEIEKKNKKKKISKHKVIVDTGVAILYLLQTHVSSTKDMLTTVLSKRCENEHNIL